jgi:IPT/TIG domain-containing protein
MGNFSKTPSDVLQASLKKNYVGVSIEQGVPVLDRDLNLLQDLILTTVRSVISRFIGDGVAVGSNGFAIQALANPLLFNNFRILAGSALVNGIDVLNDADLNYGDQPGVPPLTTPPAAPLTRTDSVFLDISQAEVSGAQDPELLNSGDVGLQTSVRQKVVWVVRVAENATSPPSPAPGHTHFPLARLVRTAGNQQIQAGMITDLRKQIFSLQQLDDRIRTVGGPTFAASPNQFSPKTGAAGTNITVFGKNLTLGGLKVRFDSVNSPGSFGNASIISGPTDTQVVVAVPSMPGLTPGPFKITVETIFGTKTSDDTFNAL